MLVILCGVGCRGVCVGGRCPPPPPPLPTPHPAELRAIEVQLLWLLLTHQAAHA